MHDHPTQTTQQIHAIVFHAFALIAQAVMHVKSAWPLCCHGNKAEINNIREHLAKISLKDNWFGQKNDE